MKLLRMADLDLKGKRVLIREDLNVPVQKGVVTSDARIRAALPTVRLALEKGARVMLLSHLGRPEEGKFDPEFSLAPVAAKLSELLGKPVPLVQNWLGGRGRAAGLGGAVRERALQQGREEGQRGAVAADGGAVRRIRDGCLRHRASGRSQYPRRGQVRTRPPAPGPLLVAELEALERALAKPARPLVAIVAGSKVSTKLTILESLLDKVDKLIVGGGIANTFLAATGVKVGKSLYEKDMLEIASKLLQHAASAARRSRCRSTSWWRVSLPPRRMPMCGR